MEIKLKGSIYTVKDEGKTFTYWLHGEGLIPVPNPGYNEDNINRIAYLKDMVFGKYEMRNRRKLLTIKDK